MASALARAGSCTARACFGRVLAQPVLQLLHVVGRDRVQPLGAHRPIRLEGDETFEADAETEKMLLESMAQCDDGRTTPFTDFLSGLRSRQ
jgi:hypothetical protein